MLFSLYSLNSLKEKRYQILYIVPSTVHSIFNLTKNNATHHAIIIATSPFEVVQELGK